MTVEQHYQQQLQPAALLAAVRTILGETFSSDQLAPIDQLHLGGRRATRQMLTQCQLGPTLQVLDVGCGLGGTSRLIAETAGCRVTGIDLTADFCHLARQLSVQLDSELPVCFVQGDAQRLPFADHSFDLIVSQHCLMNLPRAALALGEFRRVLRPGGALLLHEVLAGSGGEPLYPVPWASDASQSFVVPEAQLRAGLTDAGFTLAHWCDETDAALQWRTRHSQREQHGLPTLSPKLIYGERFALLAANLLTSLQQRRVRIVQALAR